MLAFLSELRSTGAPVVRLKGIGDLQDCLKQIEIDALRSRGVTVLLREWHQEASLDLAGTPLEFDESAARWGAMTLFRAAWFYLHRDAEATDLSSLFSESMPKPLSAEALFSVDLTMRYLADLFRIAKTLAPGDPLLDGLQHLAESLPLSGAGIETQENETRCEQSNAWLALKSHPGLWQIFIDRIIRSHARWWLPVPCVREAVQRAAGAFSLELIPALDLSHSFHPPSS